MAHKNKWARKSNVVNRGCTEHPEFREKAKERNQGVKEEKEKGKKKWGNRDQGPQFYQ